VLVGYMRVSKADGSRTTDLQRDALLAAGIGADSLYGDRASGKKDDRPQLAACLKALRHGDTLVVWKLDRLGRDLRHLVNIVHDLTERGIGLKVLTGQGAAIDTTTASVKLVFGIFAALAEFERELISERTTAGLAAARARGRNGGRPYKMTPAKLRLAMASMGKPETKVSDPPERTAQIVFYNSGPHEFPKAFARPPFRALEIPVLMRIPGEPLAMGMALRSSIPPN
jgi:DNA invertase Pin-like site-specific DNA recombinase